MDQEHNINLDKIVFDENVQERKSWACLGQTCSRSLIVFLSQLFVILLIIFGRFRRIHFAKTCDESIVWLEFCAVRQDTCYPHADYEQVNFCKKSSPYFIGWSFRNWKFAAYLQLAENWNISTKDRQNSLFYQHSQPLYGVIQKEIENLKFVRGVDFEFIDSLKTNGTKYLLILDESCEEICNSKALVEIATARRHWSVTTIYIKHNIFHSPEQTRKRR